jgi:hypothetical protein
MRNPSKPAEQLEVRNKMIKCTLQYQCYLAELLLFPINSRIYRTSKKCRDPYSGLDIYIHVNKSLSSHEIVILHQQNTHQLLSEVQRAPTKGTTYGQVLDPTAFLCHHREQATQVCNMRKS